MLKGAGFDCGMSSLPPGAGAADSENAVLCPNTSHSGPSSVRSDSFFNPLSTDFVSHYEMGHELLGGPPHYAEESYDNTHLFVAAGHHERNKGCSTPVTSTDSTEFYPSQLPPAQSTAGVMPRLSKESMAESNQSQRVSEPECGEPVEVPTRGSSVASKQSDVPSDKQQGGGSSCPLSTSEQPQQGQQKEEVVEPIPECELKRYVVAIGKTINKTEEQLYPVLRLLVQKNWLESIDHLVGLSESEWDHLELPRQLVKLLRQHLPEAKTLMEQQQQPVPYGLSNRTRNAVTNAIAAQVTGGHTVHSSGSALATGIDIHGMPVKPASFGTTSVQKREASDTEVFSVSNTILGGSPQQTQRQPAPLFRTSPPGERGAGEPHPGSGNEVEEFVRSVCKRHARTQAEENTAVQCLVEDNWFDTVDQLRALSQAQWDMLELPIGLTSLLPAALSFDDGGVVVDDSLEELVLAAGAAMGRQGAQIESSIRRLRQHGFHTAASLQTLSESDWANNLRLPLRLLEMVQKIYAEKHPQSPSHHGTPRTGSYNELSPARYSQFDSQRNGTPSPLSSQPPIVFEAIPDPRIVSDKESREQRVMKVDRFLLKMGLTVGRTAPEMEPVIQRIVKENWLDSMTALRSLQPEEWGLLGLPKRLVDAIKQGLSDPFALELNTVQFTAPETDLFPCDAIAAVWKLEGEIPPECLPDTLRALLKLMETILCNPFDESKRIIRRSNANFQKRAGQYKSGLLVLEAVGYEESGDCYLLPVAYITRITEAHAALAQVAQLHRDRLSKNKKFSKLFSSIKKV